MEPDLEVIQIRPSESFSTMCHGYPYHTVRWHFHPEFEIHQIVATRGRYFVGDFIGEFEPGNLVLTGPNLPHNWVSDVPAGQKVALRCRFIQFAPNFIAGAMNAFPELKAISPLLESSCRGVLFSSQTSNEVRPVLERIMEAQGVLRIELFMRIIGLLSSERSARVLASESYVPDPSGYMSAGMNKALAYIRENLTQPFNEHDLAAIAKQSTGAFSRSFRKHTGMWLPSVYQAPAHQHGLPDPDERRTRAGLGYLLRGRVQQSFQFQSEIPRRKGDAAFTVQEATGGQFLSRKSRLAGRITEEPDIVAM